MPYIKAPPTPQVMTLQTLSFAPSHLVLLNRAVWYLGGGTWPSKITLKLHLDVQSFDTGWLQNRTWSMSFYVDLSGFI